MSGSSRHAWECGRATAGMWVQTGRWLLVMALLTLEGNLLLAQGYGDVPWGSRGPMSAENKAKLTAALKLVVQAMDGKRGVIQSDSDGRNFLRELVCPPPPDRAGNPKCKVPQSSGATGGNGIVTPDVGGSRKKKARLAGPKKDDAETGTTVGGTGVAKLPIAKLEIKWADLIECALKIEFEQGTNPVLPGNINHGVRATAGFGKGPITFDANYLAGLPTDQNGDPDPNADPAAYAELGALLLHELLHTKQEDPKLDPRNPWEVPAYHLQFLTICYVLDWLDGLRRGDPASPADVARLEGMMRARQPALVPGASAAANASALLNSPGFRHSFEKKKKHAEERRESFRSLSEPAGPTAGLVDWHSLQWGRTGEIIVSIKKGINPTVQISSFPVRGPMFDLLYPIPMAEVHWLLETRSDVAQGYPRILFYGFDAVGNAVTCLFSDGPDADLLPDRFGPLVPASQALVGQWITPLMPSGGGRPEHFCVVDRAGGRTRIVSDTDDDGIPDSVALADFCVDPRLSDAVGWSFEAPPRGAPGPITAIFTLNFGYYEHPKHLFIQDLNGDRIADSVQLRNHVPALAPPSAPIVHATVPAPELPGPAFEISALDPGNNRLFVSDGGLAGATPLCERLSVNPGGQLVPQPNPSVNYVIFENLMPPLQPGEVLRVSDALQQLNSYAIVQMVPWPNHPAFIDDTVNAPQSLGTLDGTWDANGDGRSDLFGTTLSGSYLYVALANAAGGVDAADLVMLPQQLTWPLVSDSITAPTLRFHHVAFEERYGVSGDLRNQLSRVLSAPGPGLAFVGYDIRGDGTADDAFVALVDDLGVLTIHVGISDQGAFTWSSWPTLGWWNEEVLALQVEDLDGDGVTEFLVESSVVDSEITRLLLYEWNGSGLSATNRPVLAITDSYAPPAGSLRVIYKLRIAADELAATAYDSYVIALSGSGSTPGMTLGNLMVPLNYDWLTEFTLAAGNTQNFVNFVREFDEFTSFEAELCIPMGVQPGIQITAAYVIFDELGAPVAASNPVFVTVP